MDALLPSEIARLVLGYLQEQNCEEVAKMFLETTPLLQECRLVSQKGGRYSTKVGGLSLTDLLDKYCAANALVQEKLNKISDCEQIKQCNDLLEQMRYLLEGSRGHRFVVNISVPSQNSPTGSPIISGSTRKRLNSERGKRFARSLSNLMEKPVQSTSSQNCDVVEATPLESLPGYKASSKLIELENQTNDLNERNLSKADLNINNSRKNRPDIPAIINTQLDINLADENSNKIKHKDQATETVEKNYLEPIKNKCTAETNTEELLGYCSAEVQTGPCELIESESDINDESIENLGILTKELLQRTELHERIAENINKAILPVESSFREDNTCENAVEANISLLTDFDNAIKSVVEATETDPVFEGFLREIFKIGETDTSPDEESNTKPNKGLNNQISSQNIEPMEVDNNNELIEQIESRINDKEFSGPEVPLKQRLRSSSKSQNTNIEEEEKDNNTLLENQNAEAVMNIVNVIANKRNSLTNNELSTEIVQTEVSPKNTVVSEFSTNLKQQSEKYNDNNKINKTTTKKGSTRKQKTVKTVTNPKPLISEENIETMPTLILCSEKDVECLLPNNKRTQNQNYLPIAPKSENLLKTIPEPTPTIYLRTVNVPRHLVTPAQLEASKKANPLLLQTALQHLAPQKPNVNEDDGTIVLPVIVSDDKQVAPPTAESITLYAGENETTEVKVTPIANMPIISLDDSTISLTTGTGMSPFFKGNSSSDSVKESKQEVEKVQKHMPTETSNENPEIGNDGKIDVDVKLQEPPIIVIPDVLKKEEEKKENKDENKKQECATVTEAIIAKRTPKTLLKSRSKNNRLSLSTPRRRNSHVRALDFNTPVKLNSTAKKIPQSCTRSKSVCRAGLFKSPPFSSEASNVDIKAIINTQSVKKIKTVSPVKQSYLRIPIATRSPAPKLQGNWNKVTGIGLIIGDTSTSESSPEKSQPECLIPVTEIVEKKMDTKADLKTSWDGDLREIIGATVNKEEVENEPKNIKKITERRKNSSAKTHMMSDYKDIKDEMKISKETKINEDNKNCTKNDDAQREMNAKNDEVEMNDNVDKKPETTPPSSVSVSKISLEVTKDKNLNHNVQEKNLTKTSPENVGLITRFPNMLDLETPRKTEVAFYVPPTPRIHKTPGDNLIKLNSSKTGEDIKFKEYVDTPEFPVTPCIVITPKILEEDQDKKPSPYYEPEEHSQPTKLKEIVNAEKILIQETKQTVTVQERIKSPEIKPIETTRTEEVEKNSTPEEREKEEKISEKNSKETIEDESVEDVNDSVKSDSSTDSDDESSDSDSSTSSSSSDTSTSSSSSNSSTLSSPIKSILADDEHQNNDKSLTAESELDSPETLIKSFSKINAEELDRIEDKIENNESSPKKVFSVVAENLELDVSIKETPAKDENNVIPEADISETPSVSSAERALRRDSLTNLTSKISAIITTSQSDQFTKTAINDLKDKTSEETCDVSSSDKDLRNTAAKPKIINIQRILPADGITIRVSKMLQSEIQKNPITAIQQQQQQQQQVINHIKLSQQLEEKRLRVMAKFKEASKSKVTNVAKKTGEEGKNKKTIVRKNTEMEKVVSSTTDNIKSKNKQVELMEAESNIKVVKQDLCKEKEKVIKVNEKSEDLEEIKQTKSKASPKKKGVQKKNQMFKTENKEETNQIKIDKETIQNATKETTITLITSENLKGISKAKVDLVRRDLFSDEETNDQRTTRSQTARRTIYNQKSEGTNATNVLADNSQEMLPGVLECLQLIPAVKNDRDLQDLNNKNLKNNSFSNGQANCLDVSFVYDESVPIKKRKRKYSSSELSNECTFQFPDERLTLNVTPYEELFKMCPKSKKKVQSPKKSPTKMKKNKIIDKNIQLTTSTPLIKTSSVKNGKPLLDDKRKKSCKRKPSSPFKEKQKIEKKPKPDPQTLFNRIKIDEFLKSVHVPE